MLIIHGVLFFCEISCAVIGMVIIHNHLYNSLARIEI